MRAAGGVAYSGALDGIRALAALLIVVYHAHFPGLPGGFLGVDVFFVLSGYLITRLLLAESERTGGVRLGRFMWRRLRRLLPALLLMLLVYLVVAPLWFSEAPMSKHLRDAGLTVAYLANFAPYLGGPVSILGHVWSLEIEMHFYLLWPLVFLGLLRLPRSLGLVVIFIFYVLATSWRWWGAAHFGDVWAFYVRTDTHCSGLILGCLLGYANVRIHQYWAVLGALLLAFAVTFYSTRWIVTAQYGFTVAELGAAMLVLAQPSWLGGAVLSWLGRMSYGLYLWHYPIMRIVRERDDWAWHEVLLLGACLGLLFAIVSYYFVERRFYRPRFQGAPA